MFEFVVPTSATDEKEMFYPNLHPEGDLKKEILKK
jgi:hypothetical protein